MPVNAQGHRVIGIRHFAKELREEGLLAPRQYYPNQAATHIKQRGAARVQRWVNRIMADVASAISSGKISKRLRNGEIAVRVGDELISVPIDVPPEIQALKKKGRDLR